MNGQNSLQKASLFKLIVPGNDADDTIKLNKLEECSMEADNNDLQRLQDYKEELEASKRLLAETCAIAKVGGWHYQLLNRKLTWTPAAYEIYEKDTSYIPHPDTVAELFRPDYSKQAIAKIKEAVAAGLSWEHDGLLLFEGGRSKWVKVKGEPIRDEHDQLVAYKGFVMDINDTMLERIENDKYREALEVRDHLLNEVGAMARVGGWKVNLQQRVMYWTREVYRIHELPEGTPLSLEEAFSYYTPKSQLLLRDAVKRATDYLIPYDMELELTTVTGKKIWVRSIGKAILDENGKAKALIGTLQNIQDHKVREAQLQQQHNIIKEQKERLENFAHIVSHNLRSHAASITVSLEVLPLATEEEKQEIIQNIERISTNLHETLYHLNEVIKIKNDSRDAIQTLYFKDVFEQVMHVLDLQMKKNKARITADFSGCDQVQHIPAYMESILLNLVSNAIKYRSPDRLPEIKICTTRHNGKVRLTITDNGLGIDLHKNGHKIFGMYKTFHEHPDAKGIGLFITKNQIETLGGTIEVESQVDEGTTFVITML